MAEFLYSEQGLAFGCKLVPSINLAINSELYRRMTDDMDINCGDVLEGARCWQNTSGAGSEKDGRGLGH